MLCLLGRPILTGPSGKKVDLSPSSWRLMAVVAATPEGVARAELAEILFPASKLSSLRNLAFVTRRALERAGLALLDGEGDVLRMSEDVGCDVLDLAADRPGRPFHDIYRGPFFDMRSIEHSPWQAWLSEQRRRFSDLYVRRAEAVLASPHVDAQRRAREAQHLLKHRPDHVEATRCLMVEAARQSDAAQVEERYGAMQTRCLAVGEQVDRRATDTFHRLVGASQRRLGQPVLHEAMQLPTVHIPLPPSAGASRAERMLRSLLIDVTVGLCRASMFRVVAGPASDADRPAPGGGDELGGSRAYRVIASIADHVCGPQVVFTLITHPGWEILWTEKIEAAPELTVSAYNLLMAGVLRSLVNRIRDVELEAFRVEVDPSAYALYLAGYTSLGTLDLAQLRRGRGHLRSALSRSPRFAPTPSALARSLQLEWLVTGRGGSDLLADARGHALQAIAADPLEARGFKALAFSDLYQQDYDTALENYARAEQLNRNYADLIAEHANCLLHCGMAEEALKKIAFAMLMNPFHGDMYRWTQASALFFLSRYDETLSAIAQMDDRTPALRLLAATHALKGDREKASLCRVDALGAYPTMTIEGWTNTMAMRDPHHILHYREGLAEAGFN